MSEFPLPPPTSKKINHCQSLVLSGFFLLCSFILSHPLYFSYFIFFSPYLLKLLSFLSPLFITTFLLLLALLTITPNLVPDKFATELSESKASLVLGFYRAVVEKLRAKVGYGGDEEFHQYVELEEAYKIVFEDSSPDLGDNPVEVLEIEVKEQPLASSDDDRAEVISGSHENLAQEQASTEAVAEVKTLAGFLYEKDEKIDGLCCGEEEKEKEVLKPVRVNSNKVEGERTTQGDEDYYSPKGDQYSSSLGSFGSMRRDKEWRRTLACKLFEERRNVNGGGGEGSMDMLWEAYEADSAKPQGSAISSKAKKKGKSRFGSSRSEFSYDHCSEEYEDDEDEEEVNGGKLCCLQALKFSSGKMNLGMGRPNLVKFSKAMKGFGWLHKVGSHSKKAQRF